MLLIDEVNELIPGQRITATFWVDPAREIFKGHCPGSPVLPGVYTMEATAQATDLVLMTKPAYADKQQHSRHKHDEHQKIRKRIIDVAF